MKQARIRYYMKASHMAGTYVGAKLSERSCQRILDFCAGQKFAKPVTADDIHITVMYSTTGYPQYPALGQVKPIPTRPDGWDLFGEDKSTLVLKLKSGFLHRRHNYGLQCGMTPTYPEYRPHVTFAYDMAGTDLSKLPVFDKRLFIVNEYCEPLDPNW